MAKPIDWVSMRVRFLNSDCTLKEFAEQNGISYSIVRTRASQGKWIKERDTLNGNPHYFYKSDGSPNLSRIQDFLQIYRQLEERIRSSYDVLPADVKKKLELSISSFDLKRTIYSQGEDEAITDNFIEALESAAQSVWQEETK